MLTTYPKHFAERPGMPTIDPDTLPDLFIAETFDELNALISCYGWELIGELPNMRDGFIKVRIQRGGRQEAVLASHHPFLRLSDVKGKVICGNIPPRLSMHVTLWIVREPIVSQMFAESFTLENANSALTQYRLVAYEVFRKAVQANPMEVPPVNPGKDAIPC